MMDTSKHFDAWSFLVMVLTLVLFVAALFTKGFMHDLLLEAGVFLVSVKLILMAYKNSVVNNMIQQKLEEIRSTIQRLGDAHNLPTHGSQSVTTARYPTFPTSPAAERGCEVTGSFIGV